MSEMEVGQKKVGNTLNKKIIEVKMGDHLSWIFPNWMSLAMMDHL